MAVNMKITYFYHTTRRHIPEASDLNGPIKCTVLKVSPLSTWDCASSGNDGAHSLIWRVAENILNKVSDSRQGVTFQLGVLRGVWTTL
jgi:hypothetical protein